MQGSIDHEAVKYANNPPKFHTDYGVRLSPVFNLTSSKILKNPHYALKYSRMEKRNHSCNAVHASKKNKVIVTTVLSIAL
jgi:hypothetical protein